MVILVFQSTKMAEVNQKMSGKLLNKSDPT